LYYFISLLTGILISVMIVFNGGLTAEYGLYTATVVIHIVGMTIIAAAVLIKRENPFKKIHSWYLYLGGAIGVASTVFNNFGFGRISVSAILALGLFGQSLTGLAIDQYGFFGMPKHPFNKRKIIGLILILIGIVAMTDKLEILAVAVSFGAGVCIVVSRTLNAKLSDLTSLRVSTFFNYMVGLVLSVPVLLLLGGGELTDVKWAFSPEIYIYFGGALGVCIVLASNLTVTKISAFYLTLLVFIGQVFSGRVIDIFISGVFSARNLIGGALVAAGLFVNLLLERSFRPNHQRLTER
jgi:transporter family-2 protein